MRTPRAAALLIAALVAALVPAPAGAGTDSLVDNGDFDVATRDIDVARLTVTYDGRGARATLRMKDLRKQKRLRILVSFQNQEVHDTFYPYYGNFIEFRINAKRKQRVVNWVVNPTFDDYTPQRCRGIKVKADYDKDKLVYRLPNRCARYLTTVGYIDSYASARKYTRGHWDEGSPANSTGDWFDTTYGLHIDR